MRRLKLISADPQPLWLRSDGKLGLKKTSGGFCWLSGKSLADFLFGPRRPGVEIKTYPVSTEDVVDCGHLGAG